MDANAAPVADADIDAAMAALQRGGVIAYPTEGVWGLGCDPDCDAALQALIALKGRDRGKGLILIAGSAAQLAPWLEGLDAGQWARLAASASSFTTWLIPDNGRSRALLKGEHTTLAVRVSEHPLVQRLCNAWGGPLVSTSANRAGQSPAADAADVRRIFGGSLDAVVEGALGGRERPSTIRDLLSDRVVRP